MLCDEVDEVEYALALAQDASASSSVRPQTNKGKIAEIKGKMLRDLPLQMAKYGHIFSNTDRPPGIDFDHVGSPRPFAMLADKLCFMEYFPFDADKSKIKSRICWMMLLLTELECPRLLQPVKVYTVPGGSLPGFYTFSRVPSNQLSGVGPLHTLAECVSRVRNKKGVLVQLSEAVEEIHKHTIIHKNICAHNIILDEAENTWLAGFSSSRLEQQDSYRIPEEEKVRMKMVYYDSMEPWRHVRSFKCDIYALGVTMLEVAVGKSFVESTELIKSRSDIFKLLHDRCKACPLKDLIRKCLEPEARSRPHAIEIRLSLKDMGDQDMDDFFCSKEI